VTLPGSSVIALLLLAGADAPAIRFTDRAAAAGLSFRATYGQPGQSTYILETTGTGAAFLDFDRDGRLDLYLVNGTTLEAAPAAAPRSALYRGRGDGTFEDVTARAGAGRGGWGQGVTAADYDNEGWPDLYLTFFGENVLLRNQGDGTFRDVTARAGVAAPGWSTGAAWADYDRDGDLDLYVAQYVDFDLARAPRPGSQPNCFYAGAPVMCGPRGLPGARDRLFRNEGDGRFTDVTERAGIDRERLRGLGVVWGDYDDDLWPDVMVADDAHPNLLYRNNRDGTFTEIAFAAGVAFDEDGRERAGMGVDCGDYDGDGRLDIVITNFQGEPNALYRNAGQGLFREETWAAGLGEPTVPYLGWGAGFADFDNDRRLDLFFANGHVYPEVDQRRLDERYAQRALVFRNAGSGRFTDATASAGPDVNAPRAARGAAFGDYDEDGRVDVLVSTVNDRVVLLRNETAHAGHWLSVRLRGRRSNRDGVGARVVLDAGGTRQVREVHTGGSYLSQSDLRAHFGLGADTAAAAIEVRWPSGTVDRVAKVAGDRTVVIEEGVGLATPGR
jgi:enediyne biosynthesis protein E4